MDAPIATKEGFLPFRGYKVWYRVVGEQETVQVPLLCLHGGPGIPHDYLEPLEAVAATGRQVIFYDQLGCGNSDQPDDPSLWTVDLFVDELGAVRRFLGLERVHLLGQSWGGMLAMQYALTQPAGLQSLVLADSPASIPQWVAEANRLRAELPPDVQRVLQEHEAAGTTGSAAYADATMFFYRRHLCRLDPWPACLNRSFEKFEKNPQVYHTMWGPSEFYATGSLKNWNVEHRLGEIRTPTLVLGGRYDEATPAITETVHRGIRGSEWVIFENSSHTPHIEETARYMQVLGKFLQDKG